MLVSGKMQIDIHRYVADVFLGWIQRQARLLSQLEKRLQQARHPEVFLVHLRTVQLHKE